MDSKTLKNLLKKLHACEEEVSWANGRSLHEAWENCERGDWMLWLCGKMVGKEGWPSREQIVLAACCCAEKALRFIPKGEDRPSIAIEVARKWTRGEATIQDVRAAAAYASASSAAAAAAYAAASASAYSYAAAAYAAYAAASASAASKMDSLKSSANIVRSMLAIPIEVEK